MARKHSDGKEWHFIGENSLLLGLRNPTVSFDHVEGKKEKKNPAMPWNPSSDWMRDLFHEMIGRIKTLRSGEFFLRMPIGPS